MKKKTYFKKLKNLLLYYYYLRYKLPITNSSIYFYLPTIKILMAYSNLSSSEIVEDQLKLKNYDNTKFLKHRWG